MLFFRVYIRELTGRSWQSGGNVCSVFRITWLVTCVCTSLYNIVHNNLTLLIRCVCFKSPSIFRSPIQDFLEVRKRSWRLLGCVIVRPSRAQRSGSAFRLTYHKATCEVALLLPEREFKVSRVKWRLTVKWDVVMWLLISHLELFINNLLSF